LLRVLYYPGWGVQEKYMKMAPEVDSYIAGAPEAERKKLEQLRKIIVSVAPCAIERISYGMPHYRYKGQLAYFRLCNTHLGLYIPPPVIAEHRRELKEYKTTKAAVHLPLNERIPAALVRMLIKARKKKNEEGVCRKKDSSQ
jgi:uncharacterized protein YdhG (YjbR/CyaY superfamily)